MGKATRSGWHCCSAWGVFRGMPVGDTPHPAMPHWDRVCAQEDAWGRQGAARVGSTAGVHSLLLSSQGLAPCLPTMGGDKGHGEARAALPAALPGAFPPAQEEGVCRQWKHGVFS